MSEFLHARSHAGIAGPYETAPQQPRAESCSPTDDGWTLQLWFHFVSLVCWTFLNLLGFFHTPADVLLFVHLISSHFICSHHSLFRSMAMSVSICVWPYSQETREYFGLFGPKSTHPGVILQSELLQAVNASWKIMSAARLFLGFHKWSGQIVFARHQERWYPSFGMSFIIEIIGTTVQNLTLRAGAFRWDKKGWFFSTFAQYV